jgi:hypothetical protein
MSTSSIAPVFSNDGMWWWDGQSWQPAVSADGRMRWDGLQWRPIPGDPVSLQCMDDRPTGHAAPRRPARSIKIAAPVVAIVALVAMGSILLVHMLAPQMVSGSGYTFQAPQGWRWYRPTDPRRPCGVQPFSDQVNGQAVDIAQRPILPDVNWTPDSTVCGPHQEGSADYYAIFVYVGLSLDQVSFKPPAPWATPGYDAKIPIAFPGATRGQEAECDPMGSFPMWCWHIPGGQKSDSVDRNPPMCGPETLQPTELPPNNGVHFRLIGRFISVSHASRDYLIVLSGFDTPISGFPEGYCSDFYQALRSWKWQS